MSTIINNYPVFEDSQVLTSGQLNQMIKYLDQQNRLTRVTLTGMGIVCGMKVSCDTVSSKTTLTISKGVGVTSEGFLIGIGDCYTTRYRDYNMPGSVSYPPFEHQNLKLYELLTESAITNPEDVVADLDESFLSNKVVLLYLECFDKDLKSCLGKSCDELGIDRIFTLRKLLIDKTQLEKIEGGKSDASYPDKNLLPPHLWPRPLMNTNVTNYYEMGITYLSALNSGTFMSVLGQTYEIYEPVLSEIYGENPFSSSIVKDKLKEIMGYIEGFIMMNGPVYGVQYIHNFVKDLGLAYNDFREVSFNLSSVCCPDMDRFPKHLMLGEACGSNVDGCKPLEYRNEFSPSPVLNQQQDLLENVRFLHKRIVLMIENFDLDRLKNLVDLPMKITPSCEKKGNLSQRTIPIYYDSKRNSDFENLGTLENSWNYENYKRCLDSDYPRQLSYDNHKFNNEPEHPVTTPLGFELDQFNFFRIEGILNKSVEDVKNRILEAKSAWNLSFDVKTIHFGELLQENRVPDCLVADLQPNYSIWRHELLLLLNNLVRANKTVEATFKSRREFKAEFSKATKKPSGGEKSDHSTMFGSLFDMQEFTGRAGTEGKLDLNAISRKLYESEIKLAGISDPAKTKRLSASFVTAEDTSISSLFADMNNCLLGLIRAMPEDFKDFSMAEWLERFKCGMQVYIRAMKFISTYAKSNVSMIRTMVILMIMCLLFDVIRFLAIYPYITIRTLYDTLQERIDRFAASLEFSNFQKEHPGMEHKAGVASGDTFILVYQNSFEGWDKDDEKIKEILGRLNEKNLIGHDQQPELSEPDLKKMTEALQKMKGMVVADFTLPYLCCDECSDLPHTPLPLDPLVTPICGIVSFADQKFSTYRPLSKKILNNVYDPAVYKAELISDPKLGKASLSETTYLPEPSKVSQVLDYEVDLKLIEEEKKVNDDYIFIDEFDYQVRDVTRDEIVGKDKIILFIPITRKEQITVKGKVTAREANGNVELAGAHVVVIGKAMGTTTGFDGTYELRNVPEGALIKASFVGYLDQSKEVQAGDTGPLNFVLETAQLKDIDYDRQFKALDIEPETPQAKTIKDYYSSKMGSYIREIDRIKDRLGESGVTAISTAKKAIRKFSDEKKISVVKLNNEYNSIRNDLIKEWEKSSGTEKELNAEALQNLTNAYLERLAFTQPEKLTNTSKDVLKETGSIINDNKELKVKESIQNWLKNSEGYVSNDYRANVKRHMNIK